MKTGQMMLRKFAEDVAQIDARSFGNFVFNIWKSLGLY